MAITTIRGAEELFTTVSPPVVTAPIPAVDTPSGVTQSDATLNGHVNPGNGQTTVHFEWGTSAGSMPNSTPNQVIAAGNVDVSVAAALVGVLSAGITYYYKLVASNSAQSNVSSTPTSFTTSPPSLAPSLTLSSVSGIDVDKATLNGSVNPNNLATTAHFAWGPTSGSLPNNEPVPDANFTGSTAQPLSAPITGLTPGKVYYYRLTATSSAGTSLTITDSFTTTLPEEIPEEKEIGVVPGTPFDLSQRPRTAVWELHLARSSDLGDPQKITNARDRQLQLVLDKSGSLSFQVPLKDPIFANVEPIKHCVIAYRDSVPIWSGPIWVMEDQAPGRLQVNCVGWFELLNHRELRVDVGYPRFVTPPITITGGQIVFDDPVGTPGTDGYYPGGLLTQANAQQATWITEGTSLDTMLRVIAYTRGQNIGGAITSLTEIEAGFDFTIDPITRQMDITNWDGYQDRSSQAVFGYNWGPNNLASMSIQHDASSMVNRMTAMGTFGGGLAEDIPSQQQYQLFEETVDLSDVTDPNVLLAYAGGEVVLRSKPRTVYSLQPFPWTMGRIPEPFVEFGVGDVAMFSAKYGDRINIENQKVRIFGMTVSITNEGNEKLGPLQVSP